MGFEAKQFLKTKFVHRTEDVPVPDLAAYFSDGAKAVWTVRSLTGQELGRVKETPDRLKKMSGILSGLMSSVTKEVKESIETVLGGGTLETPDDIAIRLGQLVTASVEPKCTLDLAVRICEVAPVTFYQLTNRITILTGQGQEPGKQKPSGTTAGSGPALPSAMPGGDSSMK